MQNFKWIAAALFKTLPVQSVHKVNSSPGWLPAVQTLGLCAALLPVRMQSTDVDSCRQPSDSALWMTKSCCCSDHLPPRWRHRLDISNTLASAVRQGRPCPLVTEVTVWHSNGGDTQLESRMLTWESSEGKGALSYSTANNIQFERLVGFVLQDHLWSTFCNFFFIDQKTLLKQS